MAGIAEAQTVQADAGSGWWSAERRFGGEPEELRVARAWCREAFGDGCGVLDEFLLVLSELFGNCVRHGAAGDVTLTVAHDGHGNVQGTLTHHAPPRGAPVVRGRVVHEISELLADEVPDLDGLAEDGRGLPVVQLLCTGGLRHRETPEVSVFGWAMSCECRPAPA